jgi:3-hydroxybutyryl-CoA dehydratase
VTPRVFRDPAHRCFEDFEDGAVVRTRRRTIDASDLTRFAALVGNYYPLHIDAELARASRFGARLAHGSLVMSMAIGLFEMTGYFGDAVVAMLEMNHVRALHPVHPGDTLQVEVRVSPETTEQTGTSRHGVLVLGYTVLNERSIEVMTFEQRVLVRRSHEVTRTGAQPPG